MVRLMRSQNHSTKTNQFVMKFLDWETFFQAMLDRPNHTSTWNVMAKADCIIGGVDTSISYMYVNIVTCISLLIQVTI
jgi:hypothetical protein